jgi:hypothetical protein
MPDRHHQHLLVQQDRLAARCAQDRDLGGADAAYDTLVEIQQLLQNGTSGLDALLAAVNNRVRFDAAQSLTVAEQLQARSNIGAVAAADVGNTDTDFVAVFVGRWSDEPRIAHRRVGRVSARGQDQDRRHPSRLARAWVCFGYVGGQVVSQRAQRGQRDAHGGGPLPRDISPWRCRMRTTAGRRSRAAAPTAARSAGHRARQPDQDRPVRRHLLRHHCASFDDEINLVVYR